MKILHVNTIDTGGASKAAVRLHLLLLDQGIDSKILFLKRTGSEKIREAYYFEDLYPSRRIFRWLDRLNTFYNRRYTFHHPDIYFNGPDSLFNLSKHPLFQWADIVHLHWVVKFLDWGKTFRNKSKRFVWTLHDMNPFTGGEHYQTGYNKEFPAVSTRNISGKKKAVSNNNITIISPSEWLGQLAQESTVFNSFHVNVIRNPIDIKTFNTGDKYLLKVKHGLPPEKKIILFVAENPDDRRKGYTLLLDAMEHLDLKDNIHLAVIGKKTKLPETVRSTFFGTIREEAVLAELYNASDLFVIPSLEDNLPNTVSEALLCGTPVAGFNIGGIPDLVKNGETGYLSEDLQHLGNAISKALSADFGQQNIRNKTLEELDPAEILKKVLDVYKS